MYERFYGKKYNGDLSTAEIAKLIRAEIKAAVKVGVLPAGKYSVTSERFSGGSSIDVRIKELSVPFLNLDRIIFELEHGPNVYCHSPILNETGEAVQKTLQAMMDAYNHDGSEIQSDYFDVKFYGHAKFDWELMSTTEKALKSAVA